MFETAIRVNNLSKTYKLYDSPIHRLKESLHPLGKIYHQDFHAVENVDFSAYKGETLGIIGRNGSGKSTLLKMITGVLTPSSGSVEINGRVSALLELGAGFNPEMTGIENVYLTGTLKGYSKKAMDSRLADILSFADIGEFSRQPIKTYSGGMLVRLAFAAAINVDPDILIIDEALAVGDVKFQRKCYAKFDSFRKSGKTILFVAHNEAAIKKFCDRVILLDNGRIVGQGDPDITMKAYLKILFGEDAEQSNEINTASNKAQDTHTVEYELRERDKLKELIASKIGRNTNVLDGSRELRVGNKIAEIIDFGIMDGSGVLVTTMEIGKEYTIFARALFYADIDDDDVFMGIGIGDVKGLMVYATNTLLHDITIPMPKRGSVIEGCFQFVNWLAWGDFFLSFAIRNTTDIFDKRIDACHFKVRYMKSIGANSVFNLNPHVSIKSFNDLLAVS